MEHADLELGSGHLDGQNRIKDRQAPHILKSIGGIGKWGATVLYCEIGDIARFNSADQLIAYAGLDPQWEESGDQRTQKSISKQGNRRIRSILYGCVISTLRDGTNPPVRALFDRLKQRGKHQKVAEVACMRTLLAIVYGCWSRGEGNHEMRGETKPTVLNACTFWTFHEGDRGPACGGPVLRQVGTTKNRCLFTF